MTGYLVFSDGEILQGEIVGKEKETTGKLIFDTRVVGYEEVLTNPAYCRKIVCFSYPLIGNYGINYEDSLTDRGWPAGIIIGEYSKIYSNFRARESLGEFMRKKNITGISGIDTQYVTKKSRDNRNVYCAITLSAETAEHVKEKTGFFSEDNSRVLNEIIHSDKEYKRKEKGKNNKKIIVLSAGITNKEINQLKNTGFSFEILSLVNEAETIQEKEFDGIYISSGPEFLSLVEIGSKFLKKFLGKKPIFGSGFGHLVAGILMGGKISDKPVNHFGINQPVKSLVENKNFISEQNHSLVFDTQSLREFISHINLNDGTVEGLKSKENKIFSVSFSPAEKEFSEFFNLLKGKEYAQEK
jgi:carbamoyl-phosphate synthase small subunit